MFRIGPLDSLRAIIQRLQREGGYWISRVTRLVPGARSRRPQSMDLDDFKGSPVLLVVVGCVVLLCLCVAVVVAILGILIVMPQIGM
jgi:hypothetical protein